ncbi:MAG: helix-turn-helix domain-containing protein [Sandaracinaceae bacterium]
MPTDSEVREVLAALNRRLDRGEDVPLADAASLSGWSEAHLHRALRRVGGETLKQLTLRRRLDHAAEALVRDPALSIRRVGEAAGFGHHASFTRAFVRVFGRTPSAYRDAFAGRPHNALNGACIKMTRTPLESPMTTETPEVTLTSRDAQPILYMRQRVARDDIATALAGCLPAVFQHCMAEGVAMAGPPFARYRDFSLSEVTLEAGVPTVEEAGGTDTILSGALPAGEVAMATHVGPYDTLMQTHAVLEQWMREQGREPSGGPWESYITDPGEVPDPKDWQTLCFWPLA